MTVGARTAPRGAGAAGGSARYDPNTVRNRWGKFAIADWCRCSGGSKARLMPWKVKKLRKVGPFWLPARASVEHVDPRSAVVRRVTHRPLFGHGHHHDAEIDVRAVGEPNETPIDR